MIYVIPNSLLFHIINILIKLHCYTLLKSEQCLLYRILRKQLSLLLELDVMKYKSIYCLL